MKTYSITEADVEADRNEISPILKRNVEGYSPQRYEWNYYNCPYGKARCWLAKHNESNSHVGSLALFPRKIFLENEPLKAGIIGDFAVEREHRAFGPAIPLAKNVQEMLINSNTKFTYGIPNKLSGVLLERIGYKELGKFTRFVKILKIGRIPEEYLPSYLRYRVLSNIIDFFVKITSKELRYRKKIDYSIETPDSFDDRFDVLWEKVSKQYEIIGERTTEFLNWRYKEPHPQNYQIFCIMNENKEITGYIGYNLKDNVYHIVDMLYDKLDRTLDLLLAEFIRFARINGIGAIVVRYLGNEFLKKKLKKFNFLIRIQKNRKMLIYGPDLTPQSKLLNEDKWHFFQSDNDT